MKLYDTHIKRTVSRSSIYHDPELQSRIKISAETVNDYAERIKDGDEFPPVQVLRNESAAVDPLYYLIDGFHRFEAMDSETINVEIIGKGDSEDAIFLAAAANKTNGLQRTNEDKKKAVLMALNTTVGYKLSNREIARHCGVSHNTVAKIRSESSAHLDKYPDSRSNNDINDSNKDSQESQYREVTRNGKTYKQNVSNIGKSNIGKKQKIEVVPDRWPTLNIEDMNEDTIQLLQNIDAILKITGSTIVFDQEDDCVYLNEKDTGRFLCGECFVSSKQIEITNE